MKINLKKMTSGGFSTKGRVGIVVDVLKAQRGLHVDKSPIERQTTCNKGRGNGRVVVLLIDI